MLNYYVNQINLFNKYHEKHFKCNNKLIYRVKFNGLLIGRCTKCKFKELKTVL